MIGRAALLHAQHQLLFTGIIIGGYGQFRGAGLGIPSLERKAEILAPGGLHCCDKVVAGHGLAIVALEIDVHTPAEGVGTEQGVEHTDHLGTLVVDGQRVKY